MSTTITPNNAENAPQILVQGAVAQPVMGLLVVFQAAEQAVVVAILEMREALEILAVQVIRVTRATLVPQPPHLRLIASL